MQLINTVNPDVFKKSYTTDEKLDEVLDKIDTEEIKFSQWKRINVEKDGKNTKKIKLINTAQSPAEFATNFKAEFHLFCEHAARAKEQYEQIKQLKIKMPSSLVIAQLDFAQNYSCQALEEVQSAYWDNSEQVTLHPVVFYYKSNDGSQEIQHKSCIIISDCMVHNASTVVAFINELIIQKVKEIHPDVNFLHYWSDSPMSQYRNKRSLVSLLTTKSFLECRLPGIISTLAMEKVPAMAWVGHQREWQIRPPNATSGFNLQVIFMPGPHRWKALCNTSLLAKNTVKRLLMN